MTDSPTVPLRNAETIVSRLGSRGQRIDLACQPAMLINLFINVQANVFRNAASLLRLRGENPDSQALAHHTCEGLILAAKLLDEEADKLDGGHNWHFHVNSRTEVKDTYLSCLKCGIVMRADLCNGPCKGKPELRLWAKKKKYQHTDKIKPKTL